MLTRALAVAAIFALSPLTTGCSLTCGAVSTAGTTFTSEQYESPWTEAARASGAHDLGCDPGAVTAAPIPSGKYPSSDYYADGCGKRAVYKCNPASLTQTCEMLLVAKFDK